MVRGLPAEFGATSAAGLYPECVREQVWEAPRISDQLPGLQLLFENHCFKVPQVRKRTNYEVKLSSWHLQHERLTVCFKKTGGII